MTTPAAAVPVFHADGTLGALFIGAMVSAMLFGVTSIQTYIYFNQYHKDRTLLKVAIFVLWLIDAIHIATTIHEMYWYGVTNYGNPLALGDIVWSTEAQIILTTLNDALVRCVFTHRVYILSNHNKPLILLIGVTSALDLSFGFALAAKCIQIGTYAGLAEHDSWIMYTSLAIFALADLVVMISLIYLLMTKRTVFRGTDNIVRKLMVYTINTSALASACAVVTLITFVTMNDNFVFHALLLVLPKFYLNALLATLNARKSLRGNITDAVEIPLSQVSGMSQGTRSAGTRSKSTVSGNAFPAQPQPMIGIQVERTTDLKYDTEEAQMSLGHREKNVPDSWMNDE